MMLAVVDTETTGLDPETDCIVELAAVFIEDQKITNTYCSFIRPTCPIKIPAMATHHITEDMVADAPLFDEVAKSCGIQKADHYVAHNAQFDSGFVRTKKDWICTWRCARHLWPEAPSHSNQGLRYWLPGLNEKAKAFTGDAHRADFDAWITAHILLVMLETKTIEELVELTKTPVVLRTVGFGQHFGALWSDVPKDYLRWILRSDFDEDSKHTAKHYLNGR